MMCPKSPLLWTTRFSLPRRPLPPRISLLPLELLMMLRRLLIPRRSVLVRVRPVTVVMSFVVDPLSSTRRTMVLSKPSVTCQVSSFAASTASTSSSSPLVDTWDASASGLNRPLMPSTPSTVKMARASLRTSWPMLIWLVSSTPMRSSQCLTLPSAPTRSTSVKRILLPASRHLPSSTPMLPPLVRVSSVPRRPVRTTRLPTWHASVVLPRARDSSRLRVRLSLPRCPSRVMSARMDSTLVCKKS
mmetsp:Transcript_32761/g.59135  ORF Transcript_32761/g.59135 Transcript_32761/m.59135 type:complete len:245 (-) Transcript_32761:42-776(-)